MLISRRAALRALGGLAATAGLAVELSGCASPYADLRLSIATGSRNGVYYSLGEALSTAWRDALGLRMPPIVTSTDGSINNLQLLAERKADVAFNQIDTAADRVARTAPGDPAALRALARIYDDVVHVVVPASSPLTSVTQLRGARVALGSPGSGVLFMAQRVLRALFGEPRGRFLEVYKGAYCRPALDAVVMKGWVRQIEGRFYLTAKGADFCRADLKNEKRAKAIYKVIVARLAKAEQTHPQGYLVRHVPPADVAALQELLGHLQAGLFITKFRKTFTRDEMNEDLLIIPWQRQR